MTTDKLQMTTSKSKIFSGQWSVVSGQWFSLSGQSLIEIVISIAIAALLAISLISTTLITQRTSHSAKNNTEATKLAQEGVELIRIFRDRQGYIELTNITNVNCFYIKEQIPGDLNTLDDYSSECPDGESIRLENTIFFRRFSIQDAGVVNTKQVTVYITWDEPGGRKTVKHETFLSQWE